MLFPPYFIYILYCDLLVKDHYQSLLLTSGEILRHCRELIGPDTGVLISSFLDLVKISLSLRIWRREYHGTGTEMLQTSKTDTQYGG